MMLTLPAPAKVNLFLRVTARRADGMHELDTAFAFADAGDELRISPAARLEITCSDSALNGERNLVHRALARFAEACGASAGLRVHIEKRLPAQAGLGGGSSDAATALLAANRIWQAGWPIARLIEFAAPLGADIPCFLFGRASHARGIGERLVPWPHPLPQAALLLAWPGEGLATAEVFAHFDAASALTPQQGADTMRAPSEADAAAMIGVNDLEPSALAISGASGGRLHLLLDVMRREAASAWMSGSGSCCTALCGNAAQAKALAARLLREKLASWTHVGALLARHPLLELDEGYFIGA